MQAFITFKGEKLCARQSEKRATYMYIAWLGPIRINRRWHVVRQCEETPRKSKHGRRYLSLSSYNAQCRVKTVLFNRGFADYM